jgi:hypothetical protein
MILMGLPTYGGNADAAAVASATQLLAGRGVLMTANISAAPLAFNHLWCTALNNREKGFTKFLMMHADIAPQGDFIGKMIEEMAEQKADILSVVAPIKGENGITSTGIHCGGWDVKRFTMKELAKLPETISFQGLVVNTGLMMVDITKNWVEKLWFRYQDKVVVNSQGLLTPKFWPEDWDFSVEAEKLGAKICATRKVRLVHGGYDNWTVRGLESDPGFNIKGESK